MEDSQKLTGPRHHGFTRLSSHRSSSHSSSNYSSKLQARRLEAKKAQLALVFVEQETTEKMLELKRKQCELAQMRETKEEELKENIRLESLKTKADFKLAKTRKAAANTDIGAKLRDCAIIIWRGGSTISKVGLRIKLHPPPRIKVKITSCPPPSRGEIVFNPPLPNLRSSLHPSLPLHYFWYVCIINK